MIEQANLFEGLTVHFSISLASGSLKGILLVIM